MIGVCVCPLKQWKDTSKDICKKQDQKILRMSTSCDADAALFNLWVDSIGNGKMRGNADVRPDYGIEVIENRVGGCPSCGVLPLIAF